MTVIIQVLLSAEAGFEVLIDNDMWRLGEPTAFRISRVYLLEFHTLTTPEVILAQVLTLRSYQVEVHIWTGTDL